MQEDTVPAVEPGEEQAPPKVSAAHSWLDWLRTPTGEGSVEEYDDHALNFAGARWLSRVIRGASGFLGELDLAVVDIFMGLLEMWQGVRNDGERRAPAGADDTRAASRDFRANGFREDDSGR